MANERPCLLECEKLEGDVGRIDNWQRPFITLFTSTFLLMKVATVSFILLFDRNRQPASDCAGAL
jgi:hypothetical protein